MSSSPSLRVANSIDALDRLLGRIEAGRTAAPEWIHLRGRCRLEELSDEALDRTLKRLHGSTLRGFRSRLLEDASGSRRLALWRSVARNGFHDFGTQGFTKCYGSPFVENYDYVGGYLEGGLEGLDAYRLYTAVLGTHDYSAEDFLQTPSCEKVETIIEPMAGTGEFTYHSHFQYPELHCILFDLDEEARDAVLSKPWLDDRKPTYLVGNALDAELWKEIASLGRGRSLSYIGKQSHNLFDARELYTLLSIGTQHVDDFVLEAAQPALVSDLAEIDDLTRPEMEDAGFHAALIEDESKPANPLTNELGFRFEVWDERDKRVLFEYPRWTAWQPPTLVALGRLLDLDVLYLNEGVGDFVPVDACEIVSPHPERHEPQRIDHSEAHDNINFMLFRKRH